MNTRPVFAIILTILNSLSRGQDANQKRRTYFGRKKKNFGLVEKRNAFSALRTLFIKSFRFNVSLFNTFFNTSSNGGTRSLSLFCSSVSSLRKHKIYKRHFYKHTFERHEKNGKEKCQEKIKEKNVINYYYIILYLWL